MRSSCPVYPAKSKQAWMQTADDRSKTATRPLPHCFNAHFAKNCPYSRTDYNCSRIKKADYLMRTILHLSGRAD